MEGSTSEKLSETRSTEIASCEAAPSHQQVRSTEISTTSAVKAAVRNVFIAVLAAAGLTKLYRMREGRDGPLLRVLNFHDVSDAGHFRDILASITTQYHVITPEECFSNTLHPTRLNILLTFDDGYASWISVVLPALSLLNIKAIFFVNSGLLDAYGNRAAQAHYVKNQLLISPRDTLSWDGVRVLRGAGHTIGGHTINHCRLSGLRDHELRMEIAGDRKRIQAMLGAQITTFAYPFGEYKAHAEALVREAGYTHAFSNEPRFATADNRLRIPRLPVDEVSTAAALRYGIEGAGDLYEKVKQSLCTSRTRFGDVV